MSETLPLTPFDIITFTIFSKCFNCGLIKYKSKFNCFKNLYNYLSFLYYYNYKEYITIKLKKTS